jgi:hypothetical protein
VRISEKGRRTAYADPRLIAARAIADGLLDKLVAAKPEKASKAIIESTSTQYKTAKSKVRNLQIPIMQDIFEEEYKAWFTQECPMIEDSPTCPENLEADQSSDDLRILSSEIIDEIDSDTTRADTQPGLSFAGSLDDTSVEVTVSEDTRYVDKRRQQKGTHKEIIRFKTLADGVRDAMFGVHEMDDVSLGEFMLQAFNRMHPVDMFSAGQEPFPGSWACRFCGKSFEEVEFFQGHAKACARKDVMDRANEALNRHCSLKSPCTWVNYRGKSCNKKSFASGQEFSNHLRTHYRETQSRPALMEYYVCRFGTCSEAENLVKFTTCWAYHSHLLQNHNMSTAAGKDGERNASIHVEYCCYCDRYVSEFDEPFETFREASRGSLQF